MKRKRQIFTQCLLVLLFSINLIQLCYWSYHYHAPLVPGTYMETDSPQMSKKVLALLSDNTFYYYTFSGDMPLVQGVYEMRGEDVCIFYDKNGDMTGSGVLKQRELLHAVWTDGSSVVLDHYDVVPVVP